MSETISFANPKLAQVAANAKGKKKKGGRKMAKRRKLSKAARERLSRAAKRRPRVKTGPRKGEFLKGPRRASKKKKKRRNPTGKNALVKRRPKSDPNKGNRKNKSNKSNKSNKGNPRNKSNRRNPVHNRARSLVNARKGKIDAAELAAGTGFAEFGESLMRSTLPILGGTVAFRADEWFTDDLTRLVGVDQHSGAGKAIRAAVAIAMGMGIDLLIRRDGKAFELRMTAGEFVRNILIVKLLAEVSADLIEPGVLRLKDVPGMRLIVAEAAAPGTAATAAPATATATSGVARGRLSGPGVGRGFPAGSLRSRPNGLGIILQRSMGTGVPGALQI